MVTDGEGHAVALSFYKVWLLYYKLLKCIDIGKLHLDVKITSSYIFRELANVYCQIHFKTALFS